MCFTVRKSHLISETFHGKSGIFTPKSHLTPEEQPSEEGKLQIFFLTAKIISFLIRNSSVR